MSQKQFQNSRLNLLAAESIRNSGGDPGYAANLVRYPDRGLSIAILCNFDDPPLGQLTNAVSDIFLGVAPVKPSEPAVNNSLSLPQLTPEQLASRAGLYRHPAQDTFGRISVREGKLIAEAGGDAFELTPVSTTRFVISGTTIAFDFISGETSHAQEIRVSGAGPNASIVQRVDPPQLSSAELTAFAGDYINRELAATYTLTVVDTGLVIQRRGRPDIVLQAVFPDTFQGGVVDLVKFSRDTQGRVRGFTIRTTGVRNLEFERSR